MNKIERAIRDCKLHIKQLERDVLILETELKAFKKNLDNLESIEYDNTIPHFEEKELLKGGNNE